MRTSRFTEEQIIGIVREHEAGAKLDELCRRHNVSPTTFYKWRAKYAGVNVSEAKRLRALEEENRRLKQRCWPTPCSTTRRSRGVVKLARGERFRRPMAHVAGSITQHG